MFICASPLTSRMSNSNSLLNILVNKEIKVIFADKVHRLKIFNHLLITLKEAISLKICSVLDRKQVAASRIVFAMTNEQVKFFITIIFFNTGVYNNNNTTLDSVRNETLGVIDLDIQ